MDGGIFGLLGLIRTHRGAVEYDLSTRFGARCPKGLRSVGDTITLDELARLVAILTSDPSSAIAAALAGWDYPIDRTTLAVYDLFDVTVLANSDTKHGRPDPHSGRPWKVDNRERRKIGNTEGYTRDQVLEILRQHGHQIPV